ncbi:polysaccharide deacetylase family protein [Streptomyces sp. NPDC050504]|uniref:polysaccharide deacetylase family protein n=1 Tax=Streptomyces sp. NPDC050504 TaxID=3365618 RepID=UPI003789B487
MIRAHRLLAGTLAAGALLLSGCAQSVDPIERIGRKAAQSVRPKGSVSPEGKAGTGAQGAPDRRAAHAAWGLAKPLAPPPAPPRAKPSGPFVLDRVRTDEKVVFLTFDDGAERDPAFLRMVGDLKLPISMFLTDSVARSGYDHFARLSAAGATVQNHSVSHPDLRTLSYEGQRAEICGQQDRLKARFGTSPRLFRPPYGAYDRDTLRAARACGVDAVVLWRASMQIHDMRYADEGARLRPGDIVLAHFRGPAELKGTTLTEMTTRMLRRIQEQGFAVARLEDYV